jgi:serine/threonine protein kinase
VTVAAEAPAPVPFGERYSLIRRLATGGMAEIYLARQAAMAGFDKEIVIKRLKPELASDPRIVDMFLDEARIGALLNHPNIVHVYDVDEHEGVPYIAMEYILGEELNELCGRGLAAGKFLPLEHAIELIRQAAAGMGYFHSRLGAKEPLDIVHCDISPSNLLITEDGFLKIIDFGIARVRGQKARTEGIIPGKLSYMAPEQASRGVVDQRSDIFSLGVVLYEITVRRRLFKGKANEVVHKLVDGAIDPPTFVRRDFPPALEAIVMRALELHPGDRYQSAYDLADDLEAFLRDARLHSGPVRIARYLDELAIAQGGARRPALIAETEHREEDLDFDSQVFDGIRHAQLAPEWDDDVLSDADVAAALGLDVGELRAMRTPAPREPSWAQDPPPPRPGRPPSGLPLPPPSDADPESATNPVPRVEPRDVVPFKVYAGAGGGAPGLLAATPAAPAGAAARRAPTGPAIDAGVLARSPRAGAPWPIVVILALAVVALVVYILL